MKKILIMSILVSLFASCGHIGGHKHHDESTCGSSEKQPCKDGCSTNKDAKADVKKDKKECEACKKAS